MKRVCVALCLLSILLIAGAHAVAAVPEQLIPQRMIVLAARKDRGEAIDIALTYAQSVDGVRVVLASNGWYAIMVGPTSSKTIAEARQQMQSRIFLPSDAYIALLNGFRETVFEAPQSPARAIVEYKSSDRPVTLRHGPITVTLETTPNPPTTRRPIATVQAEGTTPLRTALADMGVDGFTFSRATVVRLDATTPLPQVFATFYSGGAHCCTSIRIMTLDETGKWISVVGPTVDGGRVDFEDIDGDGAAEILSIDQSFLYTFSSYSESYAPPRVYRLEKGSLRDVSKDREVRPYIERALRFMERDALTAVRSITE